MTKELFLLLIDKGEFQLLCALVVWAMGALVYDWIKEQRSEG